MTIRPLRDRVLIRPDEPEDMTESGLHVVEHRKPEQSGTVSAVSRSHPQRDQIERAIDWLRDHRGNIAAVLSNGYDDEAQCDFIDQLMLWLHELSGSAASVRRGERVVFSWTAGQELLMPDSGERYFMIKDSDLLAVIDDDDEPHGNTICQNQ